MRERCVAETRTHTGGITNAGNTRAECLVESACTIAMRPGVGYFCESSLMRGGGYPR